MEWMAIIGDSVQYIEDHITEDISTENELTQAMVQELIEKNRVLWYNKLSML